MAFNMSNTKNPMPVEDPNVRNKNFLEVAKGYSEEQIDSIDAQLSAVNSGQNEYVVTAIASGVVHLLNNYNYYKYIF